MVQAQLFTTSSLAYVDKLLKMSPGALEISIEKELILHKGPLDTFPNKFYTDNRHYLNNFP